MQDAKQDAFPTTGAGNDGSEFANAELFQEPPRPKPRLMVQRNAHLSPGAHSPCPQSSPPPSPRTRSGNLCSGSGSSSPLYASPDDDTVVRKPTIPRILHGSSSSSNPDDTGQEVEVESSISPVRPSSILKKRRDLHAHGAAAAATGGSVSFELDDSMTRTKSTDSNLSCESETGYWSSGSGSGTCSTGSILKSRKEPAASLEYRRSSLGNTGSDSERNELQSILKSNRKHSLDSSAVLRETSSSSSPSSLSMHSLGSPGPEPKPILKNVSSSEDVGDESHSPPRPSILKKRADNGRANANATINKTDEIVRPILKRPTSRGSRSEEDDDESHSHASFPYGISKGILKRIPPTFSNEAAPSSEIRPAEEIEVGTSVAERKAWLLQMNKESRSSSSRDSEFAADESTNQKRVEDEELALLSRISPSVKSRRHELLNSMLGRDSEAPTLSKHFTREVETTILTLKHDQEPETLNICSHSDSTCLGNDETDTASQKGAGDRVLESAHRDDAPSRPIGEDDGSKAAANLIKERIAALKADGEASWLKRVPEKEIPKVEMLPIPPPVKSDQADESVSEENVERRKMELKSDLVANRLTLLEKSQEGWRQRVSDVDAATFTVQGRLEMAGKVAKHTGYKTRIKSKLLETQAAESSPPLSSANGCGESHESHANGNENNGDAEIDSLLDESHDELQHQDAFDRFFTSSISVNSSVHQIEESSFSSIVGNREQMLGFRQRVRVNRKNLSKNPVKVLTARLSPDDSEINAGPPGSGDGEPDDNKSFSLKNDLAPEALAGLKSKEDYSAIKLKQPVISVKGYPHPMLLQIKGKRFVQTKLVCPAVSSLNNGDCFILVTGADQVFQYIGEYSNRMERSKSAEVLAAIKRKGDLGCGPKAEFYTIEQPCSDDEPLYEEFLSALGGGEPDLSEEKLGDEFDEEYETEAITANRVFKVDFKKEMLIPMNGQPGWASQPKYSLFADDRSVLVFDFGSEMYVWSGSRAEPEVKKLGAKLGREIFEPSESESKRPSWCWFKKLVQFMEPVLFREKFFDWPDDGEGRLKYRHHAKRETYDSGSSDYSYNFEPCDPKRMLESWSELEDASLELECSNVGRGKQVRDEVERRTYVITTLDVVFCHISDFSTAKLPSVCHFYSTETYVIRWSYYVTHTSRDLKGGVSKHAGTRVGRDRIAYFFWHGAHSKITEKGISALMTVELDEEKGPQVRVDQGFEPPAFLALFKGLMFTHSGSPEECKEREHRLYVTMGGVEDEGHFVEVTPEPSSFRSRSSLIYKTGGTIFVWHGYASFPVSRKIASKGAQQLIECQNEVSRNEDSSYYVEMEEGQESQDFLSALNISDDQKWRESYGSCMEDPPNLAQAKATQFYHFTSINGVFEAVPLMSARQSSSIYDPFPILQEELLSAQQPALFLVCASGKTWLWQGRIEDTDDENLTTGSQKFRWAAEKKAALETAISYCDHHGHDGFLIHAGHEPPEFRALFPYWQTHDDVEMEGTGCIPLLEAVQPYRRQTYTLEELQAKPDGVDVLKLESYLTDPDFIVLLKMSRDEFDKLQAWKKTELKKQIGLF